MPARKHRPGKFGTQNISNKPPKVTLKELELIHVIQIAERQDPHGRWPVHSYIEDVVESLVNKGYLVYDGYDDNGFYNVTTNRMYKTTFMFRIAEFSVDSVKLRF